MSSRRHLLKSVQSLCRGFSNQTSQEKSDAQPMAAQKQDPLEEKVSLHDIRQKWLEKVEEEKFNKLVKLEESVDLPYQLHGVQNRPEKKVPAADAAQLHGRQTLLRTQGA